MAYADEVFKSMCKDIIENGTDTKGELVRPVWPDTGEKAYTIKKFGVVNRYDLRKEFPALTLRKTMIRSAVDELLWIWQKKSNNVNVLNSHIWDEWADATGSIGKAYGYQIGKRYAHHVDCIDIDQTDVHAIEKAAIDCENRYKDYPSIKFYIIDENISKGKCAHEKQSQRISHSGKDDPAGIGGSGTCVLPHHHLH